jgi:chromate transporter
VVVGIMVASTFYFMKDVNLLELNISSLVNAIVILGTFLLLHFTKLPAPILVAACLMLGFVF